MLLVVAATEPELRGASGLRGVETLACGIGPVAAAAATALRLGSMRELPMAILHVGIAGARRGSGVTAGDVVIGDAATYCDSASPLVRTELAADSGLVHRLRAALPDALVDRIGTSADVGGTSGCRIEAMEGFGVLEAARAAGVPAVELRVVSNEIEEPDRKLWRFDLALQTLAWTLPLAAVALASLHDDD